MIKVQLRSLECHEECPNGDWGFPTEPNTDPNEMEHRAKT